ncbi:nitrate reductase molybdenum cofactor assembly chaperone [Hoyosella subflava]|uniref:Putative nitrate reductase delta subunit n=1 Tax=Hoyosella subflava (strain DSM 45089 / JCM 17490 / NBRC 109087 / DQS3-9A1) TaxID=443218 RepID=F6EPR4_HOYSD|nr:nitrate reductase molybdenum cofactor assembly chaperone [Hoyosella subflava]AEF40543.1 Putative nitrate reductase delta subunit [Hoyosella subflava DQS3-9A1]
MSIIRGRRKRDDYTERDMRLVWRLCALLLDYPHPRTLVMLPDLVAAVARVPGPARAHLKSFLDYAQNTDQITLAGHYVETFDMRRRSSLHLTYYAYGDTRKRGGALLMMKQAYRSAGAEMDEQELPDYLPAVLEFASTIDARAGGRILARHRAVLELLRLSLHDSESPYAAVVDALCDTLRPLTTTDRAEIRVLAAEGPPEEEVGLDPYSIDPTVTAPELLPTPSFPGASGGHQ